MFSFGEIVVLNFLFNFQPVENVLLNLRHSKDSHSPIHCPDYFAFFAPFNHLSMVSIPTTFLTSMIDYCLTNDDV